jgi:hypothetical protein
MYLNRLKCSEIQLQAPTKVEDGAKPQKTCTSQTENGALMERNCFEQRVKRCIHAEFYPLISSTTSERKHHMMQNYR